ncbi:interferon-induced GTP-binding protein Mx2 [Xylaria cf. heliscus]|nr:interferon-induced GTP-binding protein Mx2 [Xylaria cf. heliscus]
MSEHKLALGNQAILTKIDKLRELNIGTIVPLPQLVVVGDQSSGKSSLLESLTGFAFPRATELCTRYATQITCSREAHDYVDVSIIPRPDADKKLKAKLAKFRRRLSKLDNEQLTTIFDEANEAMGIRNETDPDADGLAAFSQDILKIEIRGPGQAHLTVIDVPGIFRVPKPGLTTETDIVLVQDMVKSYIQDSRTIILAVIPCNTDIATQEILKFAEAADPSGARTMVVLTKADLVKEEATKGVIVDLLLGKRNPLNLGYHAVQNRGADDNKSTASERLALEKALFKCSPWSVVSDRCGIPLLQVRLRELLMHISKREMPHVKAEMEQRLHQCRLDLEAMGPSRSDQNSQRLHLSRIASKFQSITQCAVNGYYTADPIFTEEPDLKLATRVMILNEALANNVWKYGHKRAFGEERNEDGEHEFANCHNGFLSELYDTNYPELADITCLDGDEVELPNGLIMDRVEEILKSNRGPEVGTFSGTILAIAFREQSQNWEPLALSHSSKAVILVHQYILRLLDLICPEKHLRDQLWEALLLEKLREAYRRVMKHARFLLKMELGGRPTTFNHYFNANLQKKRAGRFNTLVHSISTHKNGVSSVLTSELERHVVNRDNTQQVCEDVVDALASYYKVSRKRFVDSICQQVVHHFLIEDEEGPLKILSPELIVGLNEAQLEMIAGEDATSKYKRQVLERVLEALTAALKVLRSG